MTKISASTPKGRVEIEMPSSMTSEDRAKFFEEMAKLERAERIPLDFGDLSLRHAPPLSGKEKTTL